MQTANKLPPHLHELVEKANKMGITFNKPTKPQIEDVTPQGYGPDENNDA